MARTKNTKALVKGLKWMTTHEFQVVATNSTVTSLSSGETSESMFPSSLVSAAGVGAGAATSLFLPYASCEAFKQNKSYVGLNKLCFFIYPFFFSFLLIFVSYFALYFTYFSPFFKKRSMATFKKTQF